MVDLAQHPLAHVVRVIGQDLQGKEVSDQHVRRGLNPVQQLQLRVAILLLQLLARFSDPLPVNPVHQGTFQRRLPLIRLVAGDQLAHPAQTQTTGQCQKVAKENLQQVVFEGHAW